MGVKTFTEFKSDLTFELGQRENISTYTGGWVNTAYMDFCSMKSFFGIQVPRDFRFPELDTSTTVNTAGSATYVAVPADCLYIYTVHDTTNDSKLRNYNIRQYTEETGRATTTGQPDYWVRYGSYIYLFPTPAGTYTMTIWYRKRPALLAAADSVTAIGTEWDEPILKLAVVQSLLRVKDYDAYKIYKEEWKEMIAGKIGIYDEERKDKEDILRPSVSYLQPKDF